MFRRSTFSLFSLSLLLAAAPSVVGCSAAAEDSALGSSGDELLDTSRVTPSPAIQPLFADPTAGLVGRGFNRRAPLSRLFFVPGTLRDGGWVEAAATDRAACVNFAGIVKPTSSAIKAKSSILMVDSKAKVDRSASLDGAQSGDASLLLPIEGIPVPVAGSTTRNVSAEFQTDLNVDRLNLSFIASAALDQPFSGSGNATISPAVVNDILARPASERRSAFFAKCGDRYLDNVTLGAALAVDVAIEFRNEVIDGKFKGKLNERLRLGAGGERNTTGLDVGAALSDLLGFLSVSSSSSVNTRVDFNASGTRGFITVNVRALGPVVNTAGMTIAQAIELTQGLATHVQTKPSERAILSAVQKPYATTTNASTLSGAIPGEFDSIYPVYMEAARANYRAHYAWLNTLTVMERDLTNVPAAGWFDAPPTSSTVRDLRSKALTYAAANAAAMDCLSSTAPGSPRSAFDACMRTRLPAFTTTSTTAQKFPRLSASVVPYPAQTVDLMAIGQGSGIYPAAPPRRKVSLLIERTFQDFVEPLRVAGITSVLEERQDTREDACQIVASGTEAHFRSGPADDGNWLTGSKCTWQAFPTLRTALRLGWSVKGMWNKTSSGSTFGIGAGELTAPGDFSGRPESVSGTVVAEHLGAQQAAVILSQVTAAGPLDVTPNNLNLFEGTFDIRTALRPSN